MDSTFKEIKSKREKALKDLQIIVESSNAEALLSCMIAQLLFVSPEQNLGDTYGNHPAMLEALAKICIEDLTLCCRLVPQMHA